MPLAGFDWEPDTEAMDQELPPLRLDRSWERELHDRTIQELYAISLRIENSVHLIGEAPARAGADLKVAIAAIDSLVEELRERIYVLSRAPIADSEPGHQT